MRLRLHRLRALFGRRRFEAEMAVELRSHIEAYTDDLVRRGWTRAAAARRARIEFGSVESVKEELRQTRGLRVVDEAVQDLRFAARALARGPALAVIAVVAFGVGLNLAVFCVVQAVLLRPLPHPDADRLVAVVGVSGTNGQTHNLSVDDVYDLQRQSRSFEALAMLFPPGFNLTGRGPAERVAGARVNSRFFEVFGIRPVLGRSFLQDEERPGAERVAIIGHAMWSRRFNRDPGVVGQPLMLSGIPHTVVGVLPERFDSPAFRGRTPEIFVPLATDPKLFDRGARALQVFARLRPGVSVDQVSDEASAIVGLLRQRYPDFYRDVDIRVRSLHAHLTGASRDTIVVLALSVGALLLVAAANTASLLLGWTLRRRPELAVRMALGAGRGRLVRQVSTEGIVLALVAGVVAFAVTTVASDAIVYAARIAGLPRSGEIRVGGDLLLLGIGLAVSITMVAAISAALLATRAPQSTADRAGAATIAAPRRRSGAALIVAEAALSLAVLAGAGFLLRSFLALQSVDPGLIADDVVVTTVSVPADRYPEGPVMAAFYKRLVERVREVPGVIDAAVVDWMPLGGTGAAAHFSVDRRPTDASAQLPLAELRVISTDYFRTLRIPLRAGRSFESRDSATSARVVVVNDALAQRYFGAASPIGRILVMDRDDPVSATIVGVVGDVRQYVLQEPPSPEIFAPRSQSPWMNRVTRDLIVRTASGALVTAPIAVAIRELEPDVPLGEFSPMRDVVDRSLRRPRVQSLALLLFALTATLLAAFGIHGAVAASVTERTREFGLRLALGAHPINVWWAAARYGAIPAITGLMLGLPLAFGAGQILRRQLFAIAPTDLPTLASVTAILGAVAVVAAIVPAWRATRVDPVIAIRT